MSSVKSIAIDGPSGAGKSTLARLLAEELGYLYVDTGAIYRTVGLFVLRSGVDPKNETQVAQLLKDLRIDMNYGSDGLQHMLLNGEDVTNEIRKNEVSMYASYVSVFPAVRAFLLEMQRDMARRFNVVMDGRDIGTQVLPEANVKLFLTADAKDRARRRYEELLQREQHVDFSTVLKEIAERDEQDTRRTAAPLCQAEDAVLVDTTGNTLEKSFHVLLQTIKERLNQ